MSMERNRYFEWKNVRIVPILHNRMEFAVEVRRQFLEYRPDTVAVEYPPTLKEKIIQGVKRLPLLSVIYYEEEDGTFVYLLIEPTDGQVEAIRCAISSGIDVEFVDRDTEGYPFDYTPMPDSYAINRIGHYLFCKAYMKLYSHVPSTFEDELRERAMAFRLQRLSENSNRVLFVCGLYHLAAEFQGFDGLLRAVRRLHGVVQTFIDSRSHSRPGRRKGRPRRAVQLLQHRLDDAVYVLFA